MADPGEGFDWVGNIESNIFSEVFGAFTEPLVGWLTLFTGNPSDPNYGTYQTLLGELSTIASDITKGFATLKQEITDATLVNPVTDSELASTFGEYPAIATLAQDLLAINNILAGIDPQYSGSLTPYIPTLVEAVAPRFYSDQGDNVLEVFEYFKRAQEALLTMLVELSHQGDGWNLNNLWSPVPCNYTGAAAALTTYHKNIQQQRCFFPFPTSGIGYQGKLDGLGCDQIVVDETLTSTSPVSVWGYQNARNPVNMPQWSPGITMPSVLNRLAAAGDTWMVVLPMLAELQSLGGLVGTVYTLPWQPSTLTSVGFNIIPTLGTSDRPVPMWFPFVAWEATLAENWGVVTTGSSTAYFCNYFFDIVANLQCSVFIYVNDFTGDVFKDIQNIYSVQWQLYIGDNNIEYENPGTGDYLDVLYKILPTTTDPPLEEPPSLAAPTVLNAAGTVTTMQVLGNFIRLAPGHAPGGGWNFQPVQLDVTQDCYWSLGQTEVSIATISNDHKTGAGIITWGTGANASTVVQVTAVRGSLASPAASVSPPSGFQAPLRVPTLANLYVSPGTLGGPGQVQFNVQVLYSDNTTSLPPSTEGSPNAPANISVENANFSFAPSDTSICTPVSPTNEPGLFGVSGGNSAGIITMKVTHMEYPSVTAQATVTVPVT